MRVAPIVEAVGDPPRTVGREIRKQIDHLAIAAAAVDQPTNRVTAGAAAFAANDAQHPQSRTKIVKRNGAVARHDDASRHGNARRLPVLDS
jgi:hypothetical protein